MAMIEDIGKNLQQSAGHVLVATQEVATARDNLMIGQGMLLGVAAETENSALGEAIAAYAKAVEAVNDVLGHLAVTHRGVDFVIENIGQSAVFPAYKPDTPTLKL